MHLIPGDLSVPPERAKRHGEAPSLRSPGGAGGSDGVPAVGWGASPFVPPQFPRLNFCIPRFESKAPGGASRPWRAAVDEFEGGENRQERLGGDASPHHARSGSGCKFWL